MATSAEKRRIAELENAVTALVEKEVERDTLKNESPRDTIARTTKEQQVKEIWDNLERLGGKQHDDDDDILFQGSKLVIPETMSIPQARTFLERKEAEQERETVFTREFRYRPWDGAWCMWNVFKRQFGASNHRGRVTFGMFGPMEEPPQMVTVNSNVGEQEQIPWGVFEIPSLPHTRFETMVVPNPEYGELFGLTVSGPKKFRYRIEGIFEAIERELRTNSLYRGKAFDGQTMPEFVDVYSVDRSRVVYSDEVTTQLEGKIWGKLRYTEANEAQHVKLKKAVLLHGAFGTGKTLALMLTGQEAIEHGWTFIKLRPGRDDLATGLKTARLYQPCVVAYEDIDVVAGAVEDGDRSAITRLLDDFDGIDAKGTKILAVLTTNYPEKIHKGMARPGRLDAMIEIGDLDERGVEALVKVTVAKDTLDEDVDWAAVFEAAEGYKPAFVTGFASDAVEYLIVRCEGNVNGAKISTADLVSAAKGLRPQYEKMQDAKDITEREPLGVALDNRMKGVIQNTIRPDILIPQR